MPGSFLDSLLDVVGEQEEVLPLLSIADLFLLPSAQESFGLAALEAMACEVPVVASRVGGLPEVVDDGVTGFLHAPEEADAMAANTELTLPTAATAAGAAHLYDRNVRRSWGIVEWPAMIRLPDGRIIGVPQPADGQPSITSQGG